MGAEDPAPPWPDEVIEEAIPRIGRACFGLLFEEKRWVHRRVERYSVLSPELFHRSSSVDFTVPELFRDALAIRGGQWLVPIATLPKELLRNFDLRDETGRAVPILGREHNAQIAEHAIRAAASLIPEIAELDGLPDELQMWISRLSGQDTKDAEAAIDEMFEAAEAGDARVAALLEDRRAALVLSDLASRYLLFAVVDSVEKRRILKYRYELSLTWQAIPRAPQRLGWEPLVITTEVPEASRAASYHVEIVVPEELRIDGSFIYDAKTGAIYAFDGEADRAALHAPSVSIGSRPRLTFGVRLERSGFPTVAMATAWITALILALGAWFGDLSTASAPEAALSLLLAGSALFAGAVARSGEHQLVRAMFFLPRVLLVLNALAGLSAGAVLALSLGSTAIQATWYAAAVAASVTAAILSITFYRAARPRR